MYIGDSCTALYLSLSEFFFWSMAFVSVRPCRMSLSAKWLMAAIRLSSTFTPWTQPTHPDRRWHSLTQPDAANTPWQALTQPDTAWTANTPWQTLTQRDTALTANTLWQTLTDADRRWQTLTDADRRWQTLIDADTAWHSLTQPDTAWTANTPWQTLTDVDSRWHSLTQPGTPRHTPTHPDTPRHTPTHPDTPRHTPTHPAQPTRLSETNSAHTHASSDEITRCTTDSPPQFPPPTRCASHTHVMDVSDLPLQLLAVLVVTAHVARRHQRLLINTRHHLAWENTRTGGRRTQIEGGPTRWDNTQTTSFLLAVESADRGNDQWKSRNSCIVPRRTVLNLRVTTSRAPRLVENLQHDSWRHGGRVTNAVGTIFRNNFVRTRAHPI